MVQGSENQQIVNQIPEYRKLLISHSEDLQLNEVFLAKLTKRSILSRANPWAFAFLCCWHGL